MHWDYREIREHEHRHAATYEYARSCPWLVVYWENWLKTTIPGVRSLKNGEQVIDTNKKAIVGDVLQKYPLGLPDPMITDLTAKLLRDSFPRFLRKVGLEPLLLCATEFPRPWLLLSPNVRSQIIFAVPAEIRPRVFTDAHLPDSVEVPALEALKRAWKGHEKNWETEFSFEVRIDFSKPLEVIEGDFAHWLRWKRELLQENGVLKITRINPGRKAEVNKEALTWLACYHFREANISYQTARTEIAKRKAFKSVSDPLVPMPDYIMDSKWSQKTTRVKKHMSRIFIPSSASSDERDLCRWPYARSLPRFTKNLD